MTTYRVYQRTKRNRRLLRLKTDDLNAALRKVEELQKDPFTKEPKGRNAWMESD